MIKSLDTSMEQYTQPVYDPYGHTPVDGMSTIQQVTPIDQNPVQPPGWQEPVGPEQGSPQIGPIQTAIPPTTTTPPTSTIPPTNTNTPTTPPVTSPPMNQTVPGLNSMVGLDFARQVTPNELVSTQLNNLTNSNSAYMQNARRRGAEYAGSRGNLNSSIGAGAAQRASLEAGLPIATADAASYGNAGNRTFDAADRIRQMGIESYLGQNDAAFSAQQQDWLNNNTFNREFNGQLALMPIANAADMWAGLMNLATQNPEVFTPTVLAGYQDFFQRGFDEYMSRYLGGGGGP